MDQCDEGLAVPLVRAGLQRGAALLLHGEGRRAGGRARRARRRRGPAQAQGGGGEGTRGVRAPGRPMGKEEAAGATNGGRGGGGISQWGGAAGRWSGGGEGRCCCWRRAAPLAGAAAGPARALPAAPGPRTLLRRPVSPCPGALLGAGRVPLFPALSSWPRSGGSARPAGAGGAAFSGPCAPRASFPRLSVRYGHAWRARCRPAGASRSRIDFPVSVQRFPLPSTNFLLRCVKKLMLFLTFFVFLYNP